MSYHDTNILIEESQELRKSLDDVFAQLTPNDDPQPCIVVWGLLNSGKSSLLNMLTDHTAEPYFAVADRRETTTIKEFVHQNRRYIDTPGLDANDQDDEEALMGIKNADIVLFVHQAIKELDQSEIEFLQGISGSFGGYAKDHIIMVLSKIDEVSDENINQIQQSILRQCQEYLSFEPKCLQISNNRYKKGITEHKNILVAKSHIPKLQELIDGLMSNVPMVREQRFHAARQNFIDDMLELLQDKKDELESNLESLDETFTEKIESIESFKTQMSELVEYIDEQTEQYEAI